jgi:hypothetical protein
MIDPSTSRIVVVVFKMAGCSACEEYVPRFKRIAQHYTSCIPIMIIDANDKRYEQLATRLNVSNVPATYVMRRPHGVVPLIGAGSDAEIQSLLDIAAREAVCPTDF